MKIITILFLTIINCNVLDLNFEKYKELKKEYDTIKKGNYQEIKDFNFYDIDINEIIIHSEKILDEIFKKLDLICDSKIAECIIDDKMLNSIRKTLEKERFNNKILSSIGKELKLSEIILQIIKSIHSYQYRYYKWKDKNENYYKIIHHNKTAFPYNFGSFINIPKLGNIIGVNIGSNIERDDIDLYKYEC